jgi:membrane-associated protease RseP (regulator of RpoE activity)
MAFIRPNLMRQTPAAAKVMPARLGHNKNLIAGLLLFSLGALFMTTALQAAEVNLYAKNYNAQNSDNLKSLEANPDTKMFASSHKDEDNISMLEDGYDMIGSSGFDAEVVPAEQALEHAKSIKADTVLVYSKYASTKTTGSKLQLVKEAAKNGGEIEAEALVEAPVQYHYYASYWAKLPMPTLGVNVIKLKLKTSEEGDKIVTFKEEPGLKIIAVIKASPAAKAGVVTGDVLLKIGDVELVKSDDLFAAVQRYAGQTVAVEFERNSKPLKVSVALNARR